MFDYRVLSGLLAAVLLIAAFPGLSVAAHGHKHEWRCSAATAECATVIIHVYAAWRPAHQAPDALGVPNGVPLEHASVRISRLGRQRTVLTSAVTKEHHLSVLPGLYVIGIPRPGQRSQEIIVTAGQTLELTLHSPAG